MKMSFKEFEGLRILLNHLSALFFLGFASLWPKVNGVLCFSIYADANQIACIRKQRILCPLCLILNNFCILWRSKYNTGNSLLYSSQQIKIIFFKCFNQMMSV